jgi:methylsterol monooxygenase
MAGTFAWVEKTGRPEFVARYRIQSGTPRRPPLGRTLRLLALNQLLLTPLMMTALWGAMHLRGWRPQPTLPGAPDVLWNLACITVLSAVWFYASHRFLHRPWWMKRVHRVHHEFRTASCLAAEYAHPVEMVFGNFGTLAIGVLVVLPDLATLYIYTVLATLTFVGHHSGYAVPWMSWSVHHDWHHYRYKEAFGTFGVLDHVLGTQPELAALQDGQEVR